ncbi:MAG: hydrogenase maturation protease [Bacillota bacterium]
MRTIVVGIGNPVLTDDSFGIKVAEQLSGIMETRVLSTTGFDVIDAILGYERAYIIDGVNTGANPGTIMELTPEDLMVELEFSGTHNLHLGAALHLGYRIFSEEMPREIKIFAVEVKDAVNFGIHCTPAVEAAITMVVDRVKNISAGFV